MEFLDQVRSRWAREQRAGLQCRRNVPLDASYKELLRYEFMYNKLYKKSIRLTSRKIYLLFHFSCFHSGSGYCW